MYTHTTCVHIHWQRGPIFIFLSFHNRNTTAIYLPDTFRVYRIYVWFDPSWTGYPGQSIMNPAKRERRGRSSWNAQKKKYRWNTHEVVLTFRILFTCSFGGSNWWGKTSCSAHWEWEYQIVSPFSMPVVLSTHTHRKKRNSGVYSFPSGGEVFTFVGCRVFQCLVGIEWNVYQFSCRDRYGILSIIMKQNIPEDCERR